MFAHIRSLLHTPPTPQNWELLCQHLEAEREDTSWFTRYLPYVLEHLKSWPCELRVPPDRWLIQGASWPEQATLLRLCRRLDAWFMWEDPCEDFGEYDSLEFARLQPNGAIILYPIRAGKLRKRLPGAIQERGETTNHTYTLDATSLDITLRSNGEPQSLRGTLEVTPRRDLQLHVVSPTGGRDPMTYEKISVRWFESCELYAWI